eukprot:scaffold13390_cov376-Alexandrium_tamarense.AAC.1
MKNNNSSSSSPLASAASESDNDNNMNIDQACNTIYHSLLSKITIELACGVHRAVKTGTLSYAEVMAGANDDGTVCQQVDDGQVNVDATADSTDGVVEAKRRKLEAADTTATTQAVVTNNNNNNNNNEDSTALSSTNTNASTNNNTTTNNNNTIYKDIYNRNPSKEPTYPISCPKCSRKIAVSRFAGHLEKCMGISTRGGNTGSNNNGGA